MPKAINLQDAREDRHTTSQFIRIRPTLEDTWKSDRAQCRHCEWKKSWNISSMLKPHLLQCKVYNKAIKDGILSKDSSKKKQAVVDDFFATTSTSAEELFAMAVYTSNCSFSTFTSPEWKAFHAKLGFIALDRKRLGSTLLTSCYEKVKAVVEQVAEAASHIQIVTDGSSNIAKVRVENTSFLVSGISYYWKSTSIGAVKASAEWTVKNILESAKEITSNNLSKFTAFSSDTCSTQRKVWRTLNQEPGLEHVLSIPCDSHGTQLIIKDLLFPGKDQNSQQITTSMGRFFAEFSNKIVSFFLSSSKQLVYLRDAMVNCGGIVALISTVPTRWGTQVRQLVSINKSSEALKAFADRLDDDPNQPILLKNALRRHNNNWQRNLALERVLEPIHTFQKMSESNHATLDKVYPRWIAINSHLQAFRRLGSGPWAPDIEAYCAREGRGGWNDRIEQQLRPIHLAAYMLLPVNQAAQLTIQFKTKVDNFILHYAGQVGFHHWCQYRKKEGPFTPLSPCWQFSSTSPESFWEISESMAPELSKLALDLLHTTANSVPSERAFSTMNLLQGKLRNRLTIGRMDMLCFIYINSRSIRSARKQKDWDQTLFNELQGDILLNIEDEIVIDEPEEEEEEEIEAPEGGFMDLDLDVLNQLIGEGPYAHNFDF